MISKLNGIQTIVIECNKTIVLLVGYWSGKFQFFIFLLDHCEAQENFSSRDDVQTIGLI